MDIHIPLELGPPRVGAARPSGQGSADFMSRLAGLSVFGDRVRYVYRRVLSCSRVCPPKVTSRTLTCMLHQRADECTSFPQVPLHFEHRTKCQQAVVLTFDQTALCFRRPRAERCRPFAAECQCSSRTCAGVIRTELALQKMRTTESLRSNFGQLVDTNWVPKFAGKFILCFLFQAVRPDLCAHFFFASTDTEKWSVMSDVRSTRLFFTVQESAKVWS